jgi:hypothetical protein
LTKGTGRFKPEASEDSSYPRSALPNLQVLKDPADQGGVFHFRLEHTAQWLVNADGLMEILWCISTQKFISGYQHKIRAVSKIPAC